MNLIYCAWESGTLWDTDWYVEGHTRAATVQREVVSSRSVGNRRTVE
jgi:hypothetical protein